MADKSDKKPDLIWRKTSATTAEPDGDWTKEWFGAIGDGDLFLTGRPKRVNKRSLKQLRLFWALMSVVAENDVTYENLTQYDVRDDVFRKLKMFDLRIDRDGNAHVKYHSIATEKMEPSDFNELMTRCVNVICEWTGWQPKEVRDRVFEMTADKRYEGSCR